MILYGHHAVQPALLNPRRRLIRLVATERALSRLTLPPGLAAAPADPPSVASLVPDDAPHQGVALETAALPPADLEPLLESAAAAPLIILDQVTDPHNVGAVFRSALAFGAAALISQDRHSPAESGALAKAASGALEHLPWVRATNLARTLDRLAEAGYWRLGLDGAAERTVAQAAAPGATALVLGAEGRGLRPNVAAHCDALVRIPINAQVESLNISNAAAVALYALWSAAGVGR